MSASPEISAHPGKKWEGKTVDGKFPLRQWVGGSDHSSVFLTELTGNKARRAALKLIPAEAINQDDQLSSWAEIAKLTHPRLLRLFEYGTCQIDDKRFLYVVIEYAEENLAEVIPIRPLTPAEAMEVLPSVAEALNFIHRTGYIHGHIKPSNIFAIENELKISPDTLRRNGSPVEVGTTGGYAAPETETTGATGASDVWSLGATLLAVLTQKQPVANPGNGTTAVPESLPQPLKGILRQCLQTDPQRRSTAAAILQQLQPVPPSPVPPGEEAVETRAKQERASRWMAIPVIVAALFLIVLIATKFWGHGRSNPAATSVAPVQVAPVQEEPAQNQASQEQSPRNQMPQPSAPQTSKPELPPNGSVAGSVRLKTTPEVSRSAQNTIHGRVKVIVQVMVDSSGNVSDAKFSNAGPSKYFANKALAAARSWKFNAPVVNGKSVSSVWQLRFEFGRTSTQVFPAKINR